MADRTIEIIVDVNDKTGGKLAGAKKSLLELDAAAQRMHNKLRALGLQKFAATVRLIDRVTEPGSRINSLLQRLAGKAYRVAMTLNESALGKIRQIEAGLMRLTGRAYTIALNLKDGVKQKLGGLLSGAAMGAGVVAPIAGMAGVGYGVANGLQSYMDFEYQMSRVQAVSALEKNSAEMRELTERAKYMGATTEWTRSEAAQAEYYMAMAGWSPDKIVTALKPVMNLATAGGTDLATVSDIVTDSMTGFQLRAGERYTDSQGHFVEASQHYADVMAKLVTSSNTNISQLGEALKYSAPAIGAMYADKDIQTRMTAYEDASVMLGLMANAGIKGSMAGTATRAIFSRFGSENRNAYFALKQLGVDFTDENGEVRRIGDVMGDLRSRFKEGVDLDRFTAAAEALSGEKIHADTRRKLNSLLENVSKNGGKLTGADMLKMSTMLAGQEAMSGLLAVMLGNADELTDKIRNAHGAAGEMADTMIDNLKGDIKILGSAWDAFQQGFFEGDAGSGLRDFVKSVTEIINRAQKLFSDGIQIGDLGKIIFDVIGRLKNKFLELDGVGSILAAGALMLGLRKIGTTIQRTVGYFRQLRGLEIGQRLGGTTSPTTSPTLGGTQSVGTMNVTAGVVNVNGKLAGGQKGGTGGRKGGRKGGTSTGTPPQGTPPPPPPPTPPGTPPPPPPPQTVSRFAGMKSAGAFGAAFAGIFGVMDILNTKSMSAERLADAQSQIELARKSYADAVSKGAKPEQLAEYTRAIQDAQTAHAQILRENQATELRAGTQAAGAIAGTALGAALGSIVGPMGTMIGGMIGGLIGEKLGSLAADSREISTPITREANGELIQRTVDERINPLKTYEFKNPLEREERDITGLKRKTFWEPDSEFAVAENYEPPEVRQLRAELGGSARHHVRDVASNSFEAKLARYEADTKEFAETSTARLMQGYFPQAQRTRGDEFMQGQYVDPHAFRGKIGEFPTVTPTAGTWQGQSEFFDAQAQARTVTEANSKAVSDSTSAFEKLGAFFDDMFFGKAAASELNDTQLAQQAAMERGEFPAETQMPTLGEVGEVDTSTLTESLFAQLSELGEGVTEIFSGFGETILAGLQTAFEGAGEVFSGFGDIIMSGLESATASATAALDGIQSAFSGAKDAIQSTWAELPGFFAGIFDGLGGVAAAAGAAILSGLTSVCGAVIGAWESVAATVSSIIAGIQAAAASVASMIPSVGGGVGKAEGGFVASETHFFAGEHGPEVVIPLSANRRSRALDLFEKTAAILGGDALSFGGDVIQNEMPELSDGLSMPTGSFGELDGDISILPEKSSAGASHEISLGGINISFTISGAGEPQEVVQAVREKLSDVIDDIAAQLSVKIGDAFQNQALEG